MALKNFINRLFKRTQNSQKVLIKPQQGKTITIGKQCAFSIICQASNGIKIRAFVTYQNLYYLKPLCDWTNERTIHFFPEAPGNHILNIEWMDEKDHGWVSESFLVEANAPYLPYPTQVQLEPNLSLWTPSSWEAEMMHYHEKNVVEYLQNLIQPGWAVYDVGANLGLFSIVFSNLVKDQGKVYCIEANPLCVYFLRANLVLNHVSNALVFPIALGENSAPVGFTINYGNSNLGITNVSSLYQSKIGHSIQVEGISLDMLIEQFHLIPPKLVKIDIEGAEEFVVPGMKNTLEQYKPILLMELHGEKAGKNTLSFLEQFDYCYVNLNTNEKYSSAKEFIQVFGDKVLQVVALPRN